MSHVLVIGKQSATNTKVVEELRARGIDATGTIDSELVLESFGGESFDVVAFGRAMLDGDRATPIKAELRKQNPSVRFVDAIGPIAVDQIVAALTRDPKEPRLATALRLEHTSASAEVLADCHLRLVLFLKEKDSLDTQTLAEGVVGPGTYTWPIPPHAENFSLVLIAKAADDVEYLHIPL